MPLRNALRGIYSGLSGRDDPMFIGSRTSISIRLEVRAQSHTAEVELTVFPYSGPISHRGLSKFVQPLTF